MRKRIRNRVDKIEGVLRSTRRDRGMSKGKIAAAAGAAIAGAAWFARSRRSTDGTSGNGISDGSTFHVMAEEEGWVLKPEGSNDVQSFSTKRKAIAAGREQAASSAPSNLVIHRKDGTVELSHTYEAE